MLRGATFFRWLAAAALADWLIARSLARIAIFVPKDPAVWKAFQGLVAAGRYASTLCALLAMVGLAWLAWRSHGRRKGILTILLASLILLTILSTLEAPSAWMLLAYHWILLTVLLLLAMDIWMGGEGLDRRIARLLPLAAILVAAIYQGLPALYAAAHWAGQPRLPIRLFNLGELLVVLGPIGLWWAFGRRNANRHRPAIYLIALLPAVSFLVAHRLNPSLTAILAVWSTGLTLYLPAWLYALSLWLAGATVLLTLREDPQISLAILLLAAAGYAPQLSSQVFVALLALSLLANHWQDELAPEPPAIEVEKASAVPRPLNG